MSGVELLEWDSALFDLRIGKTTGEHGDLTQLLARARELRLDCIYFACRSGDAGALELARLGRFRLADVRVTMEMDLDEGARLSGPGSGWPTISRFDPADRTALEAIAEQLARWSRFWFDERFGPEAALKLYRVWIRKSWEGRAEAVLVAHRGGQPIGFITVVRDGAKGSVELLAVERTAGGRGTGRALVREAQLALAHVGCAQIRVATQGRNAHGIAFYERCGFRVADVSLIYHGWIDEIEGHPSR